MCILTFRFCNCNKSVWGLFSHDSCVSQLLNVSFKQNSLRMAWRIVFTWKTSLSTWSFSVLLRWSNWDLCRFGRQTHPHQLPRSSLRNGRGDCSRDPTEELKTSWHFKTFISFSSAKVYKSRRCQNRSDVMYIWCMTTMTTTRMMVVMVVVVVIWLLVFWR